ncbi:MAG: VCBS repeat-containing protein [Chitinophagaceae bacterium]|nr:MAG: VCBS repeat-containing protein [Chitinophagaceae bacterium]
MVVGMLCSLRMDKFFRNEGNSFKALAGSGVEEKTGWWNSLAAADFDNDGDIDYVAGNLGLNTNYVATATEPMTIYAKDFDENGSFDAFTFCYLLSEDGDKKSYPMHARDDMITQMISIRKKFPTYTSYGLATINDLLSEADQSGALKLQANYMHSSYIENLGGGKFNMRSLPMAAQAAPLYGMVCRDLDRDGNMDLLVVGNDYSMEPYSGRHDALNGLYLAGDGKGNFTASPVSKSGFFVPGDAKALATIIASNDQELLIASQNQGTLLGFSTRKQPAGKWLQLQQDDFCIELTYNNNRKQKTELYHGAGFLTQSSRKFFVDNEVSAIEISSYNGKKRTIKR